MDTLRIQKLHSSKISIIQDSSYYVIKSEVARLSDFEIYNTILSEKKITSIFLTFLSIANSIGGHCYNNIKHFENSLRESYSGDSLAWPLSLRDIF